MSDERRNPEGEPADSRDPDPGADDRRADDRRAVGRPDPVVERLNVLVALLSAIGVLYTIDLMLRYVYGAGSLLVALVAVGFLYVGVRYGAEALRGDRPGGGAGDAR